MGFLSMLIELLVGAMCLGALAGFMGPFLVVRRLSLVSDALSHALVPGLLMAFIFSRTRNFWILGIGAWVSSLLAAYLIAFLSRSARIREDSAIGIVLSGFFALGVLILGYIQKSPFENKAGLEHFFLGQMAALSSKDFWAMGLASLFTIGIMLGIYPRLRVLCFDLNFSLTHDRHSKFLERVFYFLFVVVLVLGIHAVGVLLISALLVIPAATALLFTRRLTSMVLLSASLGALSAVLGTYVSTFRAQWPTGALIVLVASSVFFASFLFVLCQKKANA